MTRALLSVLEIGALQERAARAIPAAVQEHRDGCWLRHTDSATTWWAGAALLHDSELTAGLPSRVDAAEAFYAAHAAPARFQVCPACAPGLDDELARRGYRRSDDVGLLVARAAVVAARAAPTDLRVDLEERPEDGWLHLLMAAQGSAADTAAERRLLQRVDRPCAYVTVHRDGAPVAVGRAVEDTGWVGVFGMATLPSARRRGAAAAVLRVLGDWARSRGVERMYLQAGRSSSAGWALYTRTGFEQAATYHYRTARTEAIAQAVTSSTSRDAVRSRRGHP